MTIVYKSWLRHFCQQDWCLRFPCQTGSLNQVTQCIHLKFFSKPSVQTFIDIHIHVCSVSELLVPCDPSLPITIKSINRVPHAHLLASLPKHWDQSLLYIGLSLDIRDGTHSFESTLKKLCYLAIGVRQEILLYCHSWWLLLSRQYSSSE